MAMYAAETFVLRYGTHYTSRFRIGGRIVEENFIKTQDLYTSDTVTKSMQAGAKASFIDKFSLSASYGTSNSDTPVKRKLFENACTRTKSLQGHALVSSTHPACKRVTGDTINAYTR